MNHTRRDLERKILQLMGEGLAPFGFSPRPKGQTFVRTFEGGVLAVHLSLIKHEKDVDVTVDVAVRFDAVEELVHRGNALLTTSEKAATFTLGAELGNLGSGAPYRVTVASVDDAGPASDALLEKFKSVGWPYLERYSQPALASEILARDDRDIWIHSPVHVMRAKRACALLVVMGRRSEIEELGRRKVLFLESLKDPGVSSFSRFLGEL